MPYPISPFLSNGYGSPGDYNGLGNWDANPLSGWGNINDYPNSSGVNPPGYNPNDWLTSLGIQNLTPNAPWDPLTDISGFTNYTNLPPPTEQPSLSNNVQNVTTTDQSGNPAAMNPQGTVTTALDPAQVAANQAATSGPNPLSGLGQSPIPVPGISWPVALGATAILNQGNIFGGGGSIANLPAALGNVASNPVGAVSNTVNNISDQIMGPPAPTQAGTSPIIPVSWPSGSVGQPSPQNPATGQGTPSTPTQGGTPPIVPIPKENTGGGLPNSVVPPLAPSTSYPDATTGPKETLGGPLPGSVQPPVTQNPVPTVTPQPTQNPSSPLTPAPSYPNATTGPNQSTATNPVVPAPSNPTENPTTPVVPSTPGTGVTVPPIVPVNPTMPDTSIAAPLDRSFIREGTQTNQDLRSLLFGPGGVFGNYAQGSASAGGTDFTNFQNILSQFGGANQNLTGLANQQTASANSALRQNNLNDVQSLLGQATNIRNQANPGLLGANGSMNAYGTGAQDFLRLAQQQQGDANFLSPQERNTAQQAAREAWGARGLINSPGAVGDEILNTDALLRQRQQQAFLNTQGALGTLGQSVNAQQQSSFDPFAAILGSQYGNQTNNAGSNQNLFGQSAGFSSGQLGNQYAQNSVNPLNNYANGVYDDNFNAANARNIAASNNAASAAGANTAASSSIANGFLNLLGQYYRGTATGGTGATGSCWVARSIFGANNPKWILFRHWMLNVGPKWFRALYLKHGEKFALWLDCNPWLKPAIRIWMESRINSLIESEVSYV